MVTRLPPHRQNLRPLPPVPPPGAPGVDDAKRLLDTSAATNRNLFVAFYLLLVTALILCLSITDEQLLLLNSAVKLPGLNADVPIWAFATVMPLVVMVMHYDLLHNLVEHSSKLHAWISAWEDRYAPPALSPRQIPPDAPVVLSDQLFPFFYDFASLQADGKGKQVIAAKALPWLCWMLYVWAPLTVLVIFMMRFADLQSYLYTGWHLGLVVLDLMWLKWFWPGAGKTPGGGILKKAPIAVSLLAGCWTLLLYALIQLHLDLDLPAGCVREVLEWEDDFGLPLVPRLNLRNYNLKISKEHYDIAKTHKSGKEAELWPDTITPLDLGERRLGFADLGFSAMPRVRLVKAKLQGAYLSRANLQGADLSRAKLQGADLSRAKLQGVNLIKAELQGADLTGADLQGAIFKR